MTQRWYNEHISDVADSLSDAPQPSRFTKYVGGLLAPLGAAALAFRCWHTQKAILPGRYGVMQLRDHDATAMAVVLAAVALFLFGHCFLSNTDRLYRLTDPAKTLALLAFIPALGYIIFNAIWT